MSDMSDQPNPFVAGLNTEQARAVVHGPGSLAVIAGAGSGKTRVLTQRIGWLLASNDWAPTRILAVTFTNKAAQEMKKRLIALGVDDVPRMWVGTFHGLCHRFLRRHHEAAGLDASFVILDAADQEKIVKRLYKDNDWDTESSDPKDAVRYINSSKDAGLRPAQCPTSEPSDRFFRQVYQAYQELCDKNSWLDFGELLLRCAEVMDTNEAIRLSYQTQFGHILVDEFQDTNDIQYAWIKRLSGAGQSIPVTVVGDMDQSIYSWRGAQMTNVQRFVDEFADVGLVKLEQNYRSTPSILRAANTLIGHNATRIPKSLWTDSKNEQPVVLFEARDEREEAEWVVTQARRQHDATGAWADTAVLYRSNAQSRIVEEACIRRGIPYKITGGIRFFERAEIKDALAHLSVIMSPHNDLALERALGVPSKGFGAKTVDSVRLAAIKDGTSWHDALNSIKLTPKMKASWELARDGWADQARRPATSLEEWVRWCVEKTGLLAHHQEIDRKEGSDRAENLQELISVARRFTQGRTSQGLPVVQDFLASAALESAVSADQSDDALQLMTIHAAKGLEFPCVCAIGWDEGLFPSSQSNGDTARMEEERRLAYVAITRAEQQLFISGAAERRQYGQYMTPTPSRFLDELPSDSVRWHRPPTRTLTRSSHPVAVRPVAPIRTTSSRPAYWSVHDKIVHPSFGAGVVVRVDGLGPNDRLLIRFDDGVSRVLLPQLAKIQKA